MRCFCLVAKTWLSQGGVEVFEVYAAAWLCQGGVEVYAAAWPSQGGVEVYAAAWPSQGGVEAQVEYLGSAATPAAHPPCNLSGAQRQRATDTRAFPHLLTPGCGHGTQSRHGQTRPSQCRWPCRSPQSSCQLPWQQPADSGTAAAANAQRQPWCRSVLDQKTEAAATGSDNMNKAAATGSDNMNKAAATGSNNDCRPLSPHKHTVPTETNPGEARNPGVERGCRMGVQAQAAYAPDNISQVVRVLVADATVARRASSNPADARRRTGRVPKHPTRWGPTSCHAKLNGVPVQIRPKT
eukprot:349850-Chlamydomonas_euryale.AAC.7